MTMDGIDSVTIEAPGHDQVTMTGEEFASLGENLGQLTLNVGGHVGAFIASEFTISGKISAEHQLLRDRPVRVQVLDAATGEQLLERAGYVSQVALQTKQPTDAMPRHTVRKHTITLD